MIEFDPKELKRAQDLLEGIPGGFSKAINRAINRTLTSTNTYTSKLVTADYTLKSKYVKADAKIYKSTPSTLAGDLKISGTRQSEAHYNVRPRADTTRTHRPITVEELRGSKRKLARGFVWEGDKVMQRMSEQHGSRDDALTKRSQKNQRGLPVEKITGPAVAQIVGADGRMQKVEEHMRTTFGARLDHETEALLMGWTK